MACSQSARASVPGCLMPRLGDRRALRSARALTFGARESLRWCHDLLSRLYRPAAFILDALGRFGSVVWRSLFGTAAAFCLAGGLLVSLGRPNESSAVMIIAGVLGAVATGCGLLALRVEPDTDSFGEYDAL